jgi:hypothetical protein
MAKNYRQLADSIRGRINPENFNFKREFSAELSTISYSEALTYVRLAMKGVEPEYTQRSKDAGEKVKEHLKDGLSNVVFRYQGSVMSDTHIKGYSDIDLVTIVDKFYIYDSTKVKQILSSETDRSRYLQTSINKLQQEVDNSPYTGDILMDLVNTRIESENILSKVYSVCDTTNPKAIKIKNLSLNREVDIVIANWFDDVSSIINDKGDNRGIQVYNKETNSREKTDYPFLSIKRINERGAETNGRLKKMIRFLKNCKGDSDQKIELSSFDINAICYDIKVGVYAEQSFYQLVPTIYQQLKEICTNNEKADNLVSVDGREYIFRYESKKIDNLKKLLAEVEGILSDLKSAIRV